MSCRAPAALAIGVVTLSGWLALAPGAAQDVAPGAGRTHSLAFRRGAGGVSSGVLIVPATIDGRPAQLLFDTGASYPLILDEKVATAWGYTGTVSLPVSGVGTGSLQLTSVRDLVLGEHHTGELAAGIMDIGKIRFAMGLLGTRVDGILGMPLIGRFRRVRLDFAGQKIHLEEHAPGTAPHDPLLAELARDVAAVKRIAAGDAGALGCGVAPELDDGHVLGLRITTLTTGGAAARAGLRVDDVLTHCSEERLDGGPRDLLVTVATAGAGARMRCTVRRGGETLTVDVVLGQWPDGQPAAPRRRPRGEEF